MLTGFGLATPAIRDVVYRDVADKIIRAPQFPQPLHESANECTGIKVVGVHLVENDYVPGEANWRTKKCLAATIPSNA